MRCNVCNGVIAGALDSGSSGLGLSHTGFTVWQHSPLAVPLKFLYLAIKMVTGQPFAQGMMASTDLRWSSKNPGPCIMLNRTRFGSATRDLFQFPQVRSNLTNNGFITKAIRLLAGLMQVLD